MTKPLVEGINLRPNFTSTQASSFKLLIPREMADRSLDQGIKDIFLSRRVRKGGGGVSRKKKMAFNFFASQIAGNHISNAPINVKPQGGGRADPGEFDILMEAKLLAITLLMHLSMLSPRVGGGGGGQTQGNLTF